jgi:hypothetical protein
MTDHRTLKHVCGLSGYNGMIDPPCPACEAREAAREAPADAPPATPHVVNAEWMHTHGDVLEYTCSCGVSWIDDNSEPPDHKAARKAAEPPDSKRKSTD